MNLDAHMIVPISEANKDFARVIHLADSYGRVVILKNNKPKYLVVNMENSSLFLDLTDDEKIDIIAKRVLNKYLGAFKELAK